MSVRTWVDSYASVITNTRDSSGALPSIRSHLIDRVSTHAKLAHPVPVST